MNVISLSSLSFFILVTKGLSYYIHDISKNRPYPTCSSEGRLIFLARHRRLTKYMMPPVAAIARVVVATTTPAARDRSSPVTTSAASKVLLILFLITVNLGITTPFFIQTHLSLFFFFLKGLLKIVKTVKKKKSPFSHQPLIIGCIESLTRPLMT